MSCCVGPSCCSMCPCTPSRCPLPNTCLAPCLFPPCCPKNCCGCGCSCPAMTGGPCCPGKCGCYCPGGCPPCKNRDCSGCYSCCTCAKNSCRQLPSNYIMTFQRPRSLKRGTPMLCKPCISIFKRPCLDCPYVSRIVPGSWSQGETAARQFCCVPGCPNY